MKKRLNAAVFVSKIVFGCVLFALGFNLFLEPNGLNAGGISGLAMILVRVTKFGTIGMLTVLMNLPLFVLGGFKVGKKFAIGSLLGLLFSSVLIDAFSVIPVPNTEPLIGCIYGGLLCGIGLGVVFAEGASTGGSDIIVRLLKLKWQHVPVGSISMGFDLLVVLLTGLVYWSIGLALYSGVAIFICGKVIDAVVYRFDYSKVVLIISDQHELIAKEINNRLDRGVTYLDGEGYYTGSHKKVILSAIKRQQIAELKQLVTEIDANAFIIVQEAHQVLGDGFSKYTKDSL